MFNIQNLNAVGSEVTSDLFGGNILANRGEIHGAGQYEAAINDLGVSILRFPGGSLTEYYFDINNPDSATAVHSETGEVKSMIPLSDFLTFASENGHEAIIVLPTRGFLSESVDGSGHRLPEVDEAGLRQFVRDVATGEYGEAEIAAFEIGNEYWHSGGMDAVEYGRLAAEMANIIDSELLSVSEFAPSAEHIDILVQMGYNYGTSALDLRTDEMDSDEYISAMEAEYGINFDGDAFYNSGEINPTNIVNELIISEINDAGAVGAIDGVVAHVYTAGDSNEWSRIFELEQVGDTWLETFPSLQTYVTEWNLKGVSAELDGDQDYGLFQAKEMLNIIETFIEYGVDVANVWPLIQNTDNALNMGFSYGDTNAPGEFFSLMAEKLPGKILLDLNEGSSTHTEAQFENFSVHGFVEPSELVLYIVADHTEGVVNSELDLQELVQGFGGMEVQVLGVEAGSSAGSNHSSAVIETVDPDEAMLDGFIDIPLDPGEIIQISVTDFIPTPQLQDAIVSYFGDTAVEEVVDSDFEDETDSGDEFDFPTVPVDENEGGSEEDDDEYIPEDFAEGFDMMWLVILLPLAAVLGMA